MENNDTPIINKIEVDDDTLEPTIVEVKDVEEILQKKENDFNDDVATTRWKNNPKYRKVEAIDKLSSKEFAKQASRQLFLNNFFGVEPKLSETDKRQKVFKRVFTISFLVLMLGVLCYTFYKDFFVHDANREVASFSDFILNASKNWYFLIFALITLFCSFLFKGLKLSVMCKKLSGKWHFKTCLQTGIIGHYYNNITPLAAGGQPFEIYHLSKHGVHGGTAASLPIVAFFMYQFAFVTLGVFALCCFTTGTNIFNIPTSILGETTANVLRPLAIVGLCCGLFMPCVVIVFCLLPRLCAKLVYFVIFLGSKLKIVKNPKVLVYKTLRTVIHNAKCIKKLATSALTFFLVYLISLLEVIALCSIAFFTLKFFGYPNESLGTTSNFGLQWAQIIIIAMVLYSAVSFIPTPGNSGAADFSFYWLFQLGLMGGFAFPAMIAWRFLSYYMFIVVGIIFISSNKRRDAKHLDEIDDAEEKTEK